MAACGVFAKFAGNRYGRRTLTELEFRSSSNE
jgi:hypothetical protein